MPLAQSGAAVAPNAYSSDCLMYRYKIEPCTRDDNHDWARCPFAHEKEKAKRRDPRRFTYMSLPCPDTVQGCACPRGDACQYTHSVQEYWLHPDRFKTQMCKNGAHCNRPLCFFAHRADELRFPDVNPAVAALYQADAAGIPVAEAAAAAAIAAATAAAAAAASSAAAPCIVLPALATASPAASAPLAALGPNVITSAPRAAALEAQVPLNYGLAQDLDVMYTPVAAGPLLSGPLVPMSHTYAPVALSEQSISEPLNSTFSTVPISSLFLGAAPSAPASAGHGQQDTLRLRAYLEQQQRVVQVRRTTLEQQRVMLEMRLQQLQQQEAAAAAATTIVVPQEPGSPLSVAPRVPSTTSTASHYNSSGLFCDVDMLQLSTGQPANEQLRMFPASAALTTIIPLGAGWQLPTQQLQLQQPASAAELACDTGLLNSLRRMF